MNRTIRLRYALALAAVCAAGAGSRVRQAAQPAAQAGRAARAAIVPLVDHHQHLVGPSSLPPREAFLPEVEVPPDVRRLLDARADAYGVASAADLAGVFRADAQAVSWGRSPRWVRGEQAMLEVLGGAIEQPYRFVPNAHGASESVGWVAGTVAVGGEHALDFLLAIEKGPDALWRIAAENVVIRPPPLYPAPITADKVVADLDAAGIERAVVLSVAFWAGGGRFADPADEMTREYDAVRAENDWTAAQVARHPTRLVMAASCNPLKAYALQELERCREKPEVVAFKLHVADSRVDWSEPAHVEKLARFFEAANALEMPLIVHLKPRVPYGAAEIEVFLERVLSKAPDVPVQIAHLAGDGPSLDAPDALAALAGARAAGDPRVRNLWLEFAGLATRDTGAAQAQQMVARMREFGLERVLYGSDGQPPNQVTSEHWVWTRTKLPLSDDELRTVAGNVAPYMP